MSSFTIKAKHKETGEIHEIWCYDDYFAKHEYGYVPNIGQGVALKEHEFYSQYETDDPISGTQSTVQEGSDAKD